MSATFEIKINAIRTGAVGTMTDVIRKVEFTVKGTEAGQSFELPQSADLTEPQAESFKPLAQVTEADVIAWVGENFTDMPSVHAHIQMVLDREVAKAALVSTPMPWVSAPEEAQEPAQA